MAAMDASARRRSASVERGCGSSAVKGLPSSADLRYSYA